MPDKCGGNKIGKIHYFLVWFGLKKNVLDIGELQGMGSLSG